MGSAKAVSILFVCMGNICRSPSAEGVFRNVVDASDSDLQITIDSAGTHSYHVGEPPDGRAVQAALMRGVDISGLAARVVVEQDFDDFDYILAMDEDNLNILQDIQPAKSPAKLDLLLNYSQARHGDSVPDPYYGGSAGFERVLDLLDEVSNDLMQFLRNR